ncbi:hypothetical protein bsdtb5_12980 [Anaeromicropila herbilytica]|uniref:Uncharacterized protein n=1 Tax=Anaeromicropila herbilytica TaxID=2785025 RepID=A0A7R7IBU5_9FIRM|nr:hypothetical protein bsdtb5_12980 [Anaeromicropila herbilytica]
MKYLKYANSFSVQKHITHVYKYTDKNKNRQVISLKNTIKNESCFNKTCKNIILINFINKIYKLRF